MKKLLLAAFLIILIGAAISSGKEIFFPTRITPATNIVPNSLKVLQPLTILSNPAVATVKLNGITLGTTPLSLSNLNSKSNIILEKDGYDSIEVLLEPTTANSTLQFTLTPLKKNTTDTSLDESVNFQDALDDLNANDPNIPFALAGKVVVPEGFRFPNDADITKPVALEPIPLSLIQDPTTQLMPRLDRSTLLNHLNTSYIYDPAIGDISYSIATHQTSLINFGLFEPITSSMPRNGGMLWYNQNSESCELRTDPKSPARINQRILPQTSITITLSNPGIYIFFCQGNPGPTQTITVL